MNLLKSLSWVWVSLALCLGQKFLVSGPSQICSRHTNSPIQLKPSTISWEDPGSLSLELWSTDWTGNVLFFQKVHVFLGNKANHMRSMFWRCENNLTGNMACGRKHLCGGTHLSDVTRILSSLDELKWSSFSRKYSSMHCSSKSCTFLSSSSVMKSSVGVEGEGEESRKTEQGPQRHPVCGLMTSF